MKSIASILPGYAFVLPLFIYAVLLVCENKTTLAMNIEEVRDYCLSLPWVTEDSLFDETTLVFRIEGKIIAMIDLENTEWFVLKCEPEYALELRERYPEISEAWHMNKKYWN